MEPLADSLLERLRLGDASAVGEVVRACEPYLRLVVRRHLSPALRSKLDSRDVVQSVCVQLLRQLHECSEKLNDAEHLRAYLARAVRNRVIDRYRQHRQALEREQPFPAGGDCTLPTTEPRPSQRLQAAEVWEKIQALCTPAQAEVVQLRCQGLTNDEIAERTGLHPSSVRRILYDLARRLGAQRCEE